MQTYLFVDASCSQMLGVFCLVTYGSPVQRPVDSSWPHLIFVFIAYRVLSQGFTFASAAYSWKHYMYTLSFALFTSVSFSMQHLVHLVRNSRWVLFVLAVFERRPIDILPCLHIQNICQNQLQVLEIYRFFLKCSKNVISKVYFGNFHITMR